MREPVRKEIGGHLYTCTAMRPMAGFRLATALMAHFGSEILALAFAAGEGEDGSLDGMLGRVQAAGSMGLWYHLQQAGEDFAQRVLMDILSTVHLVKGDGSRSEKNCAEMFDQHFSDQGGLKRSLMVWVWAGEVTFRSFFDDAPSQTGAE